MQLAETVQSGNDARRNHDDSRCKAAYAHCLFVFCFHALFYKLGIKDSAAAGNCGIEQIQTDNEHHNVEKAHRLAVDIELYSLFQFAAVGAGCINANLAENGGFHKQIAVFFVDFISEFI